MRKHASEGEDDAIDLTRLHTFTHFEEGEEEEEQDLLNVKGQLESGAYDDNESEYDENSDQPTAYKQKKKKRKKKRKIVSQSLSLSVMASRHSRNWCLPTNAH